MNFVFPVKLKKKINLASKALGLDERVFVGRALECYLNSVKAEIEIRQELAMWQEVRDEALQLIES